MEITLTIAEKDFVQVVVLETHPNLDNQVGVTDIEVLMERSPSIDRNFNN